MKLAFDHIIHVVEDLNEAAKLLNEEGFYTVEGGSHVQFGTYNALSYFGLSYIELLGIENYDVAKEVTSNELIPQTLRIVEKGGGFARIAIRTTNIDELAAHMKEQGFDVVGPTLGSRKREDGSVINWKYLFPKTKDDCLPLPFFIQWDDSDDARLEDLTRNGFIDTSSDKKIEYTGFAVYDLEKTVKIWSQLLGIDYVSGEDKQLGEFKTIPLSGGDLRFFSNQQAKKINDVLEKYGESPFIVGISGNKVKKDVHVCNGSYALT